MQRLLLEGMKLVAIVASLRDAAAVAGDGARAAAGDSLLTDEVFGHLATALRTEMVCATDERMGMLTAPRYQSTILRALTLGAFFTASWLGSCASGASSMMRSRCFRQCIRPQQCKH
jgi:hypothetical protein